MNFRENFSNRLSKLRKGKGVSLATVGEYLSVSDEAVRLMEKGKRSPSFEVLCALADYFDVPLDYLVGRGLFKNWEEIMENKAFILPILQDELPFLKNIDLNDLNEQMLMRLLPTMVQKVDISGTGDDKKIELTLYPLYLK